MVIETITIVVSILVGSAVSSYGYRNRLAKRERNHLLVISRYVEELRNLDNQLRLADRSAELWRQEAVNRGYKSTQVDV